MKDDIKLVLAQPDAYVYHEYMEADNNPLYLHEFVERVADFGLGYLGDAAPATMFASNFGPTIERQLMQIANDVVGVEQHLDLLRNRGFRQTLLCRKEVPLTRKLEPERLQSLYLRGYLKTEKLMVNLKSTEPERFNKTQGLGISTPSPPLKAALMHLSQRWPRACSLDELTEAAGRLLGDEGAPRELSHADRVNLGHNLVQCLASGLVDALASPDRFTTALTEKPRASRLARFQAGRMKKVTNCCHELIELDDAARNVLQYLDGQHDRAALVRELTEAVDRGDVSILVEGLPATRGAAVASALENTLDASLKNLARMACLVA